MAGMVLHVCANALDNADGQLARLTQQQSRKGRIIDSVADHLVFVSVYMHLALRCLSEGRRQRSGFWRCCWDQPCITRGGG